MNKYFHKHLYKKKNPSYKLKLIYAQIKNYFLEKLISKLIQLVFPKVKLKFEIFLFKHIQIPKVVGNVGWRLEFSIIDTLLFLLSVESIKVKRKVY